MLQEFHKNTPQAVVLVKSTLAAMKPPPVHKNYALEAVGFLITSPHCVPWVKARDKLEGVVIS
ncbi:hypothetical protein DSO57_1002692 [Entomophthora muscae]|uniref:Uncharacterized protein n=1 Tax=Entomophthora muscae TaxID=34485 RepID=A0ACC2UIL5_9FUNG|nr:hypothetical protein DSO57_1002692 [Entomophthora muscae]